MITEANFELGGSRAGILDMTFPASNQINNILASTCEGLSYRILVTVEVSCMGKVLAKVTLSICVTYILRI